MTELQGWIAIIELAILCIIALVAVGRGTRFTRPTLGATGPRVVGGGRHGGGRPASSVGPDAWGPVFEGAWVWTHPAIPVSPPGRPGPPGVTTK